MKISSKIMAAIILVVLFGGIAFTTWMGWWATETSKTPVKYAEGEAAGQYNPADIRGSYTFGDVSRLFEIPIEDLKTAFRLTGDDPASVAMKDLEALYGSLETEIGTASVRLFTARYKNLPYEPAEETYLFSEAVTILKARGTLTADQLAYLESHSVELTAAAQATPAPTTAAVQPTAAATAQPDPAATAAPTAAATLHSPTDRIVNAKTTFQDLLDWGVAQADIEAVLGKPMPPAAAVIKDYITSQGMQFSTVKTALQALVK